LPTVAEPGSDHAATGSASEYTVGGVNVRDHRSGDNAKMDVPPGIHPPNMHQISSKIVGDVAQQVREVLARCTVDLPRDARGPHPKLDGQVVVAVKGEQLTVTGATVQLRDVLGPGAEPLRQCIEQRAIGLHVAALQEPDIDSYSIGLALALP
jgi:hypothetical protein